MSTIDFIEQYLGIKLLPYQKILLKIMKIKNDIYYNLFSPIRPLNPLLPSISSLLYKEIIKYDTRRI